MAENHVIRSFIKHHVVSNCEHTTITHTTVGRCAGVASDTVCQKLQLCFPEIIRCEKHNDYEEP